MAKITTNNYTLNAKELKEQADKKGIEYKKNATAAQMQELLNNKDSSLSNPITETTDVQSDNIKDIEKSKTPEVNVNALLARLADLENLVKTTGDHNKIRDYEKAKEGAKGFSFSLKLFPTDDGDYPIINWKTLKNYVARNDNDSTNQKLEIIYLKDGEEIKQEIDLVDFVRVLKRTEPLLAKSLKNLDGSDVYIDERPSIGEDGVFYIIKPKNDIFNVELSFNGKVITILSTYLNA